MVDLSSVKRDFTTQIERDIQEGNKVAVLEQSVDRAILAGQIDVRARQDVLDIYGQRCKVDPTSLKITLDGKPLDEALAAIIAARPLWQPQGPSAEQTRLGEIEAAALAGNVSAHGALFKTMGRAAYDKWCDDHGSKAVKAAIKPADEEGKNNPWSPAWVDASGRYTAKALGKQSELVKVCARAWPLIARLALRP